MGNLVVGTDIIAIKDAINQVNQNIQQLHSKMAEVDINGYAGTKIASFYEEKIQGQQITLSWLKKALS